MTKVDADRKSRSKRSNTSEVGAIVDSVGVRQEPNLLLSRSHRSFGRFHVEQREELLAREAHVAGGAALAEDRIE